MFLEEGRNLYIVFHDGYLNAKITELLAEKEDSILKLHAINSFSQALLNLATIFSEDVREKYFQKPKECEHTGFSQKNSDVVLDQFIKIFNQGEDLYEILRQCGIVGRESGSFLADIKADLRNRNGWCLYREAKKKFDKDDLRDIRNKVIAHKDKDVIHGIVGKSIYPYHVKNVVEIYESLRLLIWIYSGYTDSIPESHINLFDRASKMYL